MQAEDAPPLLPRQTVCDVCGYKPLRKDDLTKHKYTHYDALDKLKLPYKCDDCEYYTGDRSNWMRHMRRIHKVRGQVAKPQDEAGTLAVLARVVERKRIAIKAAKASIDSKAKRVSRYERLAHFARAANAERAAVAAQFGIARRQRQRRRCVAHRLADIDNDHDEDMCLDDIDFDKLVMAATAERSAEEEEEEMNRCLQFVTGE